MPWGLGVSPKLLGFFWQRKSATPRHQRKHHKRPLNHQIPKHLGPRSCWTGVVHILKNANSLEPGKSCNSMFMFQPLLQWILSSAKKIHSYFVCAMDFEEWNLCDPNTIHILPSKFLVWTSHLWTKPLSAKGLVVLPILECNLSFCCLRQFDHVFSFHHSSDEPNVDDMEKIVFFDHLSAIHVIWCEKISNCILIQKIWNGKRHSFHKNLPIWFGEKKSVTFFWEKQGVFFLRFLETEDITTENKKRIGLAVFSSLTDSIRQTMEARKKIPVVGRSHGGALSFGQFKTVSSPQVLMNFVDPTLKQKRICFFLVAMIRMLSFQQMFIHNSYCSNE